MLNRRRCLRNMRDPNPRGKGFRLIRVLGIDHNARRLRAFVARLSKADALSVFHRRIRLRNRIKALKKAAKRGA